MAIKNRTKISASYNCFLEEITKLEIFESENQVKFAAKKLSKKQIEFIAESIFFNAYRAYENLIREVFILHCLEKKSNVKPKVKSFLKATNFSHTESLIKSSLPHLDWTSAEIVLKRSETYLKDGHPIKLPYTTNMNNLKNYKILRNHIAHDSVESQNKYETLVRSYYGTLPFKIPTPGQYLLLSSKTTKQSYILLDFFLTIKKIAKDIT